MDIYDLVNGKVRCTAVKDHDCDFTVGEIYEVKDKCVICNDGFAYRPGHCKNAVEWLKPYNEFELVEDYDHSKGIKQVIFNNPATIILWHDGTKTVAKCLDGDKYDAEKGFCIAYLKKMVGAKQFSEELHKWVKDEEEENKPLTIKELEKMDGQRVWLSSLVDGEENFTDEFTGWHTVDVRARQLTDDEGKRYQFEPFFPENGYKAYRKPPKSIKE